MPDPSTSPAPQRITAIGLEPRRQHGMTYRRVGKSGLQVSAIGLGCFPFGGHLDTRASSDVIACALDMGMNYFDTADSYGLGRSEEALGTALDGRRHAAVIATKFGNRMGDGSNDLGASRTHIVEACEASLRRLKTDHIDLYQVHWPDRGTPIDETLRALDDLVKSGKVRYIGASNFFAWELCEAHWTAERHGLSRFVSSQDFHNLLYREVERQTEPFCVKYGVGMTSYFPLAGGMLAEAYERERGPAPGTRAAASPSTPSWQSDRNWRVQGALRDFARERGWTLAQMSLAWLLSRPAMFTVIAGADSPQHVQANVLSLAIRFTPEDLDEIDRITLGDEDRSVAPVYRTLRPEQLREYGAMRLAKARAGASG